MPRIDQFDEIFIFLIFHTLRQHDFDFVFVTRRNTLSQLLSPIFVFVADVYETSVHVFCLLAFELGDGMEVWRSQLLESFISTGIVLCILVLNRYRRRFPTF